MPKKKGRQKKTLDNYLLEILERYPKMKLTKQEIKKIAQKMAEGSIKTKEEK
jgi:hypothetical protein